MFNIFFVYLRDLSSIRISNIKFGLFYLILERN